MSTHRGQVEPEVSVPPPVRPVNAPELSPDERATVDRFEAAEELRRGVYVLRVTDSATAVRVISDRADALTKEEE